MAGRRAGRVPLRKRVPWWMTMDRTPLYILAVTAVAVCVATFVTRLPRTGSMHACMDAYADARTQQDTERVDARRPYDSPRLRGPSCGELRETPAYVRMQRERQQHASPARGHA